MRCQASYMMPVGDCPRSTTGVSVCQLMTSGVCGGHPHCTGQVAVPPHMYTRNQGGTSWLCIGVLRESIMAAHLSSPGSTLTRSNSRGTSLC